MRDLSSRIAKVSAGVSIPDGDGSIEVVISFKFFFQIFLMNDLMKVLALIQLKYASPPQF